MKKIFVLSLVVTLLFYACNTFNSKASTADAVSEIAQLQVKEKNTQNTDSALIYTNKIEKIILSDSRLPDTLLIENNFKKGYYFKLLKKNDSAAQYFHKTISLIKSPNNRKQNLKYFFYAWEMDEANGQIVNAISVAQKFIEITDHQEYPNDVLYAFNALERIYKNLQNFDKAIYYNSKVLAMARQSNNMDMYLITSNSKADMLRVQGKTNVAFKLLDSLKTLKVSSEAKRQLYRTYGVLNYYEKTYFEAINNYKLSLNIAKTISNNYEFNLQESYSNIAEAYMELKQYDVARKYLDSTKAILKPNSNIENINFFEELQFKLNLRKGKPERELMKDYFSLIKDNNEQHENKINEELVALKLSNQKELIARKEKSKVEVNNVKLLSLLVFTSLIILLGYMFYRQRRYKFEKENMQMQQRLLRSQMSPHFTFNTLSVIQSQIETNPEGAINYLLKFSRLLRLILENSLNNYVLIENELESLHKYIELQLLRFPNKFTCNIILDNFEEDELLYIPPMLIQPFVENSIEHAFKGIDYKGVINIKLQLQKKWITLEIEDNGVGLKKVSSSAKNSISTQLISKFIHKTTKHKVSILDKKNQNKAKTGVIVKFLIPYKLSQND